LRSAAKEEPQSAQRIAGRMVRERIRRWGSWSVREVGMEELCWGGSH
jgi:hypothetical protein